MTRAGLFEPFVIENGTRRRATAHELREAHRLWFKHRDIREGGSQRRLKSPPTSTTSSYKAVVWSAHWKKFSKEQKALADACERCGRERPLETHHLTYERAGEERPEDVLIVCRSCHRALDRLRRRGQRPHVEVTVGEARRVVVWGQR